MKATLLAFISGILLWLAWPTYGFAGLLFIAFVPLLIAERHIRLSDLKYKSWRILGTSYISFFLWNYICTGWLYYASPFGMAFAVLVNSLLMSCVILLYHVAARRLPMNAALTFLVCLWISFERLHLHWEFSWPWLNLGNGFSEYFNWIQWYEYTGTFGGTLWVWLVTIVVFHLVVQFNSVSNFFGLKPNLKNAPSTHKTSYLSLGIALIIIPIGVSYLVKPDATDYDSLPSTEVLVVQPNIDPYTEKYNLDNDSIIDLVFALSQPKLSEKTRLLVTPETVLAGNIRLSKIDRNRDLRNLSRALLPYPELNYLGGVSLVDSFSDPAKATVQTNKIREDLYVNDYNSAVFINTDRELSLYHKSKLVVGIENMPYKGILEPVLGGAMIDLGGTVSTKTTQKERSVFYTQDSVAVAPVICYESVYGEYVTGYVKNGAHALAIITNDAWWGNTQGHQQHLSLARLRAIENRRSIARSANTGISAFINPLGEITSRLGYDKQGVLLGTVALNDEITFYAKHGDYIARIAGLIFLFTCLFAIFRKSTLKR